MHYLVRISFFIVLDKCELEVQKVKTQNYVTEESN